MSKLTELKSVLGIGARGNKYRIIMNSIDEANADDNEINILAKSTAIPGKSFADVSIWHQGKLLNIAGDISYEGTWNVTFMDSEDHKIRKYFLRWMRYINEVVKQDDKSEEYDDYMTVAQLEILSTVDDSVVATYEFEDVYPKSISDSNLSDDNPELIEFTIEFNFAEWTLKEL